MAKTNYMARSTEAKVKIPIEEIDRIMKEYLKYDIASEMRHLREQFHLQKVEIDEMRQTLLDVERKLDKVIKAMSERWTLKPYEEKALLD